MLNFILGGLTMAGIFLLVDYTKKQGLALSWWQWLLTGLCLVMAMLTVEVIAGFVGEREAQAALVIGMVLGIITIVWGVLLGRFVFKKQTAK